jgi:hypothetical protein
MIENSMHVMTVRPSVERMTDRRSTQAPLSSQVVVVVATKRRLIRLIVPPTVTHVALVESKLTREI